MRTTGSFIAILLFAFVTAARASDAQKTPPPQPIKSASQLEKLLRKQQPRYLYSSNTSTATGSNSLVPTVVSAAGTGVVLPTAATAAPNTGTTSSGATFSTTNVQVQGVDEADFVKTDGQYIYQVNNASVFVIKAEPAATLQMKTILTFDSTFYPQELFLANGKLIVIGSAYRTVAVDSTDEFPSSVVRSIVFDVSNPDNITQVREVDIDGDYISSRRVDNQVYLVLRKYPDFYAIANGGVVTTAANTKKKVTYRFPRKKAKALTPAVKDTAVNTKFVRMAPNSIFWFPGFDEPDYLIVGSFDLSNSQSQAQVQAYLGAGDDVYASTQNLYVTSAKYSQVFPLTVSTKTAINIPTVTTDIYKFALNNGQIAFSEMGTVPGTVLNQYSMDESNGYFRVATTTNQYVASQYNQSNNVYVLDSSMAVTGKLENIAPGEQIYATRFINNRCYMVTFHQVDPLFVIDLTNPTAPAVLGELKVAGFCNYLHPYDDTHLIGFGKDVVIEPEQWIPASAIPITSPLPPGITTNGNTFGVPIAAGFKMSLFDVSDVTHPVEQYSVVIGDRGTNSPVLYDPKSLLFDASKHLLALPISVAVFPQTKIAVPPPISYYGGYIFNGVYVFDLTVENGFLLRGTITHGEPPEPSGAADGAMPTIWGWWNTNITRSLYIGTDLFTISESRVKVNDLSTLNEENVLDLPVPNPPVGVLDPLPGGVVQPQ